MILQSDHGHPGMLTDAGCSPPGQAGRPRGPPCREESELTAPPLWGPRQPRRTSELQLGRQAGPGGRAAADPGAPSVSHDAGAISSCEGTY